MTLSNSKAVPSTLFKLLFHLFLWGIWIGLPIVNAGDNEKYRQFMITLIPVSLTNIPLFLLNSEWLIPKVFRKRGLSTYLISLVFLIVGFAVLQLFMKEWIFPEELMRRRWNVYWAVIPVTFVTAISTGYGLILYLLQQEQEKVEEQQEKLKSELSFLRSQISPHFIFNVLNSIVYLIRSKSNQAESVTIKLSDLMRYMLYSSGQEQVPISQELEYLKNYIDLQRVRFEEDVEIKFELSGQAEPLLIEPMLLIPFVENAFKHGVGMIVDPIIDVRIKLEKQTLHFWVKNKKSPDVKEEKDASSGIGLPNVLRRLELLYPGQHEVDIQEGETGFSTYLKIQFSIDRQDGQVTHRETNKLDSPKLAST